MSDMINTVLNPTTRQSIASNLINYIQTIPNDEKVKIRFKQTDEDGKSSILFECEKKSNTPDMHKSLELTEQNLKSTIGSKKSEG